MSDLNRKVCLFGAGVIGRTWGYDLISAAGKVDFYCDNKVMAGTIIRDNIKVIDIQYLYNNRDKIQVFLTVGYQYQEVILKQLQKHGIYNVIVVNRILWSEVLDSIEISDNKAVKQQYHAIYNDIEFLKEKFEKSNGYQLNINSPRTFNEKLQWLKLYNHKNEYIQMVDKYEVKQFVKERISADYIIPTLGIWDSFDEIDFIRLPKQFVLKCTHDSGSVVLVDDINKFDREEAKHKLNQALKINYFWVGREWPYKNVRRRIIAEKYIAEADKMIDYKFLCFDGRAKVIFTCTDRFSADGLKVTFFDTEWEKLPFERHYSMSKKKINRPQNLNLMIKLAEKLSIGIPFVRVDFYEVEGKVYFGEMTFFPGGGMEEFTPQKWDEILGDWIVLPEKTE